MEIVFTRCDCIRFPTFFFVDLYAKFYFSTCMCLSSSLIFFYIETSTFPIFGHGFRISSYRRAQVWKVHPFSKIFWTTLLLFGVFSNMNGDLSQIQEHKTFHQFLGCDGLLISYQAVLSAWRCFWLLTLAWLTPFPSLNANSSVMGTASSFPLQFSHTIPA